MNKHLHRIVFNAARGLRMVVQETARSTGQGRARATRGAGTALGAAALAAALASSSLHAQIVADPGAPGRRRPTVLAAPNGVPLVNIQTPSAAGVSRNVYSQFDVQRNGAILNNSRTNAQTQLGGWVQGNPWLAAGSARVILNEVRSANPSQLRGHVEVAGPRAEVVIANPAGIQVDGGGFINASRVTLTTGTPQFNATGALDSFLVRGGTVTIDGAGLDASRTDYAAILARAVQVNAGIWANELKVAAGAHQVSADAAPAFALDVAALGGMYAGKIMLVGTEAGVGVRNAGSIGAGAGGLVVTAAGWLENSGTLEGAKVALASAGDIDNRGGTIRQAATRELMITAPVLSNTNGGFVGAPPVAVGPGSTGSTSSVAGTATGTNTTAGGAGTTTPIGEAPPQQPAAAVGPGAITAAGTILNDGGRIYAGGDITLQAPRVDNAGGSLRVADMAVSGPAFSNAGGTLNVTRAFSADVGTFDNTGGTLLAGSLRIGVAGELRNVGGTLAGRDLAIDTRGGTLDNAGQIEASVLSIHTGDLINRAEISAADLTAVATRTVTNTGAISADSSVTLKTGTLSNGGLINANARGNTSLVRIEADTVNNSGAGAIYGDNVQIGAGTLNNSPATSASTTPLIAARNHLAIGAGVVNNLDGASLYSIGSMAIGGAVDDQGAVSGKVRALHNISATIESGGRLDIGAQTLLNERRNVQIVASQVLDETRTMLPPSWWRNGRQTGPNAGTANYNAHVAYYVDPAAILKDEIVVTPDGYQIHRAEVRLGPADSAFFTGVGSVSGRVGNRARYPIGQDGVVVIYFTDRQDGQANPDQVSGAPDPFAARIRTVSIWESDTLAYSAAYGRCTTNCVRLETGLDYTDPAGTFHRDTLRQHPTQASGNEVRRLAHHTAVEERVAPGAGAEANILSGSAMNIDIGSSLTNRHGSISARGNLTIDGQTGDPEAHAKVSNIGQTLTRTHRFVNTTVTAAGDTYGWTNPDIVENLGRVAGSLTSGATLTITGRTLHNTDGARAGPAPGALPGASGDGITLPTSSLYQVHGGSSDAPRPLIETDPRFTGHRNWRSSDHLLGQLGFDADSVLKRLGDGFYEQQLIRQQLLQLTGSGYLDGHANDEDQYTALLNAGAAFAQKYPLTLGIALSAAQMALLTSDIVWLVSETVTLPDGTRETVLVPRVYLAVRPGDLDASGALLAGKTIRIDMSGDVVNSGSIDAKEVTRIRAGGDIANLGGRITGSHAVGLYAERDILNIGGRVLAGGVLVADAGRDLIVTTTVRSDAGGPQPGGVITQAATRIDRVARMEVTGTAQGDGQLYLGAGRDATLTGAQILNGSAAGTTTVNAGRDLTLATVTESRSERTHFDAGNHYGSASSKEVGTTIQGHGNVVLHSDRDTSIRAGNVQSKDAGLFITADRHITIEAGRETAQSEFTGTGTTRKPFSKTTTTEVRESASDLAIGTRLGAKGITAIIAGGNLTGEGVKIKGDEGVLVQAGGALDLHEARDLRSESSEVSVSKRGIGLGAGSIPMIVPKKNASRDSEASYSDTASATTIESKSGGVLLQGDGAVYLQGVQVNAHKDIAVLGGDVTLTAATNDSGSSSEHYRKDLNAGSETWWKDPGKGINAKNTDKLERRSITLARSTLDGANVSISATGESGENGEGGTLLLAGTTINTPGKLTLEADQLVLATQATQVDVSHTTQGRDLMWQKARGDGTSDRTTHYNQFNVGQLAIKANRVQAGLGARDSVEQLANQPGMGWVSQLSNDPKLQGQVDWVKVEEARTSWDYKQQGLTPEGAAIVTLVVSYFTFGAASGWGAAAGEAAAVGAGEGVALAGGGAFVTGTGATISTVVGGAVTAGVTALAGQAAVASINNRGNLSDTLHELGSSANVRGLVTAILTGGVLGGLNMNPTGGSTVGAGGQEFMTQLGQNLRAGVARAVIGTAVNGGSLEDALKQSLKTAFIDTLAAQGADAIGTMSTGDEAILNRWTNKVAHALAGCAIGVAKADNSGGCGPGALGAAMGELSAELYGRKIDTVQFASMMGGIAAALAGGDAADINLASQTAGNAAANNYLKHNPANTRQSELRGFAEQLARCKATPGCDLETVYAYWTDVSASNQSTAKSSVAEWAATGDARSLGEFLAGATGALGANPADFCSAGDTRCYQFIQSQNIQAFSAYRDATVLLGSLEYVNGMPRGVSSTASPTWKVPTGYEPFNMSGLPAGSRAVVEVATGDIKVVNSIGRIVDVPSGPLPTWTSSADNGTIKIVWGKGVEAQGMPWEDYLATQLPSDARLPPNFKTFDFFDAETGVAVSAKTLDTMTSSKISEPTQVYYSLKINVDAVANFSGSQTLSEITVTAAKISLRELHVAVPAGTTAAQWAQIKSAVQYGLSRGVIVKIKVVTP